MFVRVKVIYFVGKFPEMMDKMKKVMAGEMEIVVREEK
jgi:hypothetical protein